MSIKVLLADDSDVMRTAMRKNLEEEPRIEVVGEASTFAATIEMIGDSKPGRSPAGFGICLRKNDFTPALVKEGYV